MLLKKKKKDNVSWSGLLAEPYCSARAEQGACYHLRAKGMRLAPLLSSPHFPTLIIILKMG